MNKKNTEKVHTIETTIIWVKEHSKQIGTFTKIVGIIAIVRFFLLDIPQVVTNLDMYIARDNIYLAQFETGKFVPLNANGREVPFVIPVKAGEASTLRYTIIQGNKNAPQITAVIAQFPSDAVVVSDAWRGLIWEPNNDGKNRWGLALSPFQIFSKGKYDLPALHVTFKRAGLIPFSYQIKVNKMDVIDHNVIINTALPYEDYIKSLNNLWANEVNPETYRVPFFSHGDDKQSVSASSCVSTYPAASFPTVSADSVASNERISK